MAVESKTSNNGANGTVTAPPTAKGTGANPALSASGRRRNSSLMQTATSLPTVERSLEDFIAKANQTLVDVGSWDAANEAAKQETEDRREQDQQRWKAAETQMRESAARESSLRRQLDGLQGKLAEAEARAAVAGTQMGSAAHDSTISDLKTQIDNAMHRMRAAEERSTELSQELQREKSAAIARPASEPTFHSGPIDADASERIRIAEAKAAKALAAARAAQAGLTVSTADLAAIESGLVVSAPPQKSTPWVPILAAFAGGIAIMFGVWKFVLNTDAPASAPAAAVTQPAAPPSGAAAKPSVTPIDDTATPQPAATDEVKPSAVTAEEIDEAPKAVAPTEPAVPAEPAAAKEAPKAAEPAVQEEPVVQEAPKAAAKPAAKAAAKKPAKKPATKPAAKAEGLADPFADAPAPKKPAKAEKPAGGIVDPF